MRALTHVLFPSLGLLPSLAAFPMSHLGAEAGNVVKALFGVPLHSALLASEAKLLVFEFPLGVGAVGGSIQGFSEMAKFTRREHVIFVIARG